MNANGGWLGRGILLAMALAARAAGAAGVADAPARGPAPDWVKPMAALKLAPVGSEATAAVKLLLLDTQYRFTPAGTSIYLEQVTRAQTPQGLAGLGTASIPWKPDTQTLTVHKLNILRGDQVIDALGGRPFTVLRRETNLESAVLDGVLTATVQIEGLQVGDALDMAATFTTRDQVMGRHAEAHFNWPANVAADRVRVRALWTKANDIRWRVGDDLKTPKLTQFDGETEFLLDATDVAALPTPEEAPPRFARTRDIDFGDFTSWSDVSALFAPLYRKAATLSASSPLKAQAAAIRAASSDPWVEAAAALRLVEDDVRYVFLGMNDGALTPADADTTWSRRFGDCKGKTALLLALLQELGIEAEPALVSTTLGDGLEAKPPSAQLFDHVLVRAVIAGKVYWLDGARAGDRNLGQLSVPGYHWALPIRSAGATLVPLTVVAPDEPDTVNLLRIDASVGNTVPVPAHAETRVRGDTATALRLQIANVSATDLDRFLRDYWKKRYDFIEPKTVSATFYEAEGEERIVMDGSAKMSWTSPPEGGPARYEADNARLGFTWDFKRAPGPHADAPVEIAFPDYEKSIETIVLPTGRPGFTIQGDEIDKTIAGRVFHRTARIDQGVFTMEASRRAIAGEIPAAEALAAKKPLLDLFDQALYLQEPRDYSETDAELAIARQSSPDDATGYFTRGWAFVRSGDFAKAVADYDRAAALGAADWPQLYANRALAHFSMCQLALAKADAEKAISLDPRNPRALDVAANVALRERRYGEAVEIYTTFIDQKVNVAGNLRQRSMAELWLGEFGKALQDSDEAARIDPDPTADQARRTMIAHLKSTGKKPVVRFGPPCATPPPRETGATIYLQPVTSSPHRPSNAHR